jgi:DHA1 family tetracycline resistance protein-like MFS transporter
MARAGSAVGAVVGVYSIMQFFFAPVWGRLSDRIGRRPVLLISLTASFTGYLLFAFTRQPDGAVRVARHRRHRRREHRHRAGVHRRHHHARESRAGMGLIGAAFGLGFILGPPMSGISLDGRHEPRTAGNLLPRLVAAGLSFTALLLALSVLAESKPKDLVRAPACRRSSIAALARDRHTPRARRR